MKKLKSDSILTAIIMIASGLWLFVRPGDALLVVVRILGAAILLLGAIGLLSQLMRKDKKSSAEIITAVVEAAVGLFVLLSPKFVVSVFPFFAGVIIALYGLSDVITAVKQKRTGAAVLAVITVLLGVVIFVNPLKTLSGLVRLLGIVLVYRGITGTLIRAK